MPPPETAFSSSYAEARERFRASATAAGARLTAHLLDGVRGLQGENLSIDVAVVGDGAASKALLSISGTHGLEAAAGSAAQVAFLEALQPDLIPKDTKLLFVHSLNPYGHSHDSRANEDFVDLSRNFVDFDQPLPENGIYPRYHGIIAAPVWSDEAPGRWLASIEEVGREIGMGAALTAATGGQYSHADGINFGGHRRAQSNILLEQIVREHLSDVGQLALIEWHTGFGKFGEPFFVCLQSPDDPAVARARRWWHNEQIGRNDLAFELGAAPDWHGLVYHGITRWLPRAEITGGVIEFGTYSNVEVGEALLIDRYLRFCQPPGDTALLRKRMIERFVPASTEWRATVAALGSLLHQQALSGLRTWGVEL